jgi:hypothetical protein
VVTPVRGPANGAATGSGFAFVNSERVGRAVGVWLFPPPFEEEPATIRDSGGETSLRDDLITAGLAAATCMADASTREKKEKHWR